MHLYPDIIAPVACLNSFYDLSAAEATFDTAAAERRIDSKLP